jgi:hypothetical protein
MYVAIKTSTYPKSLNKCVEIVVLHMSYIHNQITNKKTKPNVEIVVLHMSYIHT